MKKLIPWLVICMTLVYSLSFAFEKKLSTERTSSAAVVSGAASFYGIILKTDGTNNVTVTIYDNTVASGTVITPTSFVVLGSARLFSLSYGDGVKCTNGIYVDISVAGGGSASYQVLYYN